MSDHTAIPEVYRCDFEASSWTSDCSLQQYGGSTYWYHSTYTSTSGTGPGYAHGGRYFIYLESDYTITGGNAVLSVNPNLNFNGTSCMVFYYFMYGSTMGTLQVNQTLQNGRAEIIWQRQGNQGYEWKQAYVTLKGLNKNDLMLGCAVVAGFDLRVCYGGRVTIEAVRGPGLYSDIAIDDLYIFNGTCNPSLCSLYSEPSVNCTFNGASCNYSSTGSDSQWQIHGLYSYGIGLPDDHTSGNGSFMYYQNLNGNEGDSATLKSPNFSSPANAHLRFYYHMNGAMTGHFTVWAEDGEGRRLGDVLLQKQGEQGNHWYSFCSAIPSNTEMSLIFKATRGTQGLNHIAIDDVVVDSENCPYGLKDAVCDFGQPDICGYSVNCTECKQELPSFKWRRMLGRTASINTGPNEDYTCKTDQTGYYLYAEASHGSPADSTAVTFPEFSVDSVTKMLSFDYHMFGDDVGSLIVQIYETGSHTKTAVWTKSGSQWNTWIQSCVDLSDYVDKSVQISFIAVRGSGPLGDIAIDNVEMLEQCATTYSISCDFESQCDYKPVISLVECNPSSLIWRRSQPALDGSFPWADHTLQSAYGHYWAVGHYSSRMSVQEGDMTMLVSPVFSLRETDIINFHFAKGDESKLKVGYISASELSPNSRFPNVTEFSDSYTGVKTLWSSVNTIPIWTPVCLMPGQNLSDIVLVFVFECGSFRSGCFAAVDDVSVNTTNKCTAGFTESGCSFDVPGHCQETFSSVGSSNLFGPEFMWYHRRIIGTPYSSPSSASVPGMPSTYPFGGFMYTSSGHGKYRDTATMSLPSFMAAKDSSISFKMYMYGHANLHVTADISSGAQVNFVTYRSAVSGWFDVCLDLYEGEVSQVSFTTARSSDPFSLVAVDEITYNDTSCPKASVNCTFDEDFCGYIKNSDWTLQKRSNSSNGGFHAEAKRLGYSGYFTSLVSPLVTGVSDRSCVQLEYMLGNEFSNNLTVTFMDAEMGRNESWNADISNSGQWKWLNLYSNFKSYYIVVMARIGYYSIIRIDNLKVTPGDCPQIECSSDQLVCGSGDQCYLASGICDGRPDCWDQTDEIGCGSNSVDCDFNKVYLCGYHGQNIRQDYKVDHTRELNPTNNATGAAVSIVYYSFMIGLLKAPVINVTTDSCLTFYTRATNYRSYVSLLRVIRNDTDTLTSLAEFDTSVRNKWLSRSVNIFSGELTLMFEFSPLHITQTSASDGMYIDDVQLTEGYCEKQVCKSTEIYCSVEDVCLSSIVRCNEQNDCINGEDERGCVFSITCDFNDEDLCGYYGNWTRTNRLEGLNSTNNTETDQFLVAGSDHYLYNRTLRSPRHLFYGTSCLSLDVAKVHLHPYSASFLDGV
ncbi:MAM and LDL-receptor class A domain-containing protein 2-like [Saccostrea echinata]|uniref:MAM and LDL-receptor class A domain-containing protein 2-like n=1 Tax=Saccostrea echinata TaxID=191078 RepID=UPI002A82C109|nr:MAM and LDL-receptor class A domain-containing protein 2-like [Saccostrea echinata]